MGNRTGPKAALDCFSLGSHHLPWLSNNRLNVPTRTQAWSWRLNEGIFSVIKEMGDTEMLWAWRPIEDLAGQQYEWFNNSSKVSLSQPANQLSNPLYHTFLSASILVYFHNLLASVF